MTAAAPLDADGLVVGVDVGGTKVRLVLATAAGEALVEHDHATAALDGDSVVTALAEAVRAVAGPRWPAVRAVGVGVPGVVDPATGRTARCPNVRGLDVVDLATSLRVGLDRPVRVDNDVIAAALGERWLGHGRGVDDLLVLSLGTGIGAGLVVAGRAVRGAHGAAGELADTPVVDPRTGAVSTLERRVGTPGIAARYAAATGRRVRAVREVLDAAEDGDPAAAALLDDVVAEVAAVLTALALALDPAVVVLTGGVGAAPRIATALAGAVGRVAHTPPVVVSELGDRAGVLGAAALGLEAAAGA